MANYQLGVRGNATLGAAPYNCQCRWEQLRDLGGTVRQVFVLQPDCLNHGVTSLARIKREDMDYRIDRTLAGYDDVIH